MKPFAPRILVYIYYALDNRPAYFRLLLGAATGLRLLTSRIRGSKLRAGLSWVLTLAVYLPAVFCESAPRVEVEKPFSSQGVEHDAQPQLGFGLT